MNCDVVERLTTGPGDAETYARELDGTSVDVVVVAGGDGTINEVVNGLVQRTGIDPCPALGVIPLGTANVAAMEIGLGFSVDEIARTIASGPRRSISLAKVNNRVFLLMAGAGFDAHVVSRVTPGCKRLLGKVAYVLESARLMFTFGAKGYDVTIDGCRFRAASVIVCNGRHYAGPYVAAPDAALDRPDVEVCLFEYAGPWHVMRYGLALLLGRLPGTRGYRIVRARQVAIDGAAGEPVQVDGDCFGNLAVTIRTHVRRINLVYPQGSERR